MKHLYSNVFTVNKGTSLFVFLASFFIFIFIFPIANVFARDDYNISATYYVMNPNQPGKYKKVVQWKITDSNDWLKFVNSLRKLPFTSEGDIPPEYDNPMGMGVSEIIHVKQTNPDKVSGNDIYISSKGIQQFARMPADLYYGSHTDFRDFLEKERDSRAHYGDENTSRIHIHDEDIVVIYRGSEVLKNPMWRVTSEDDMRPYKNFIEKLKPVSGMQTLRFATESTEYDDVDTYRLYLNYDYAKSEYMSVTSKGEIRGTVINLRKFNFEDTNKVFNSFRIQAQNKFVSNERRKSGKFNPEGSPTDF